MSEKILTPEEASALYRKLPTMGKLEKLETLDLLDRQEHLRELRKKRLDPIEFAKHVYPGFKIGPHHRKLAKIFQEVISGQKKPPFRVIQAKMPPGMTGGEYHFNM